MEKVGISRVAIALVLTSFGAGCQVAADLTLPSAEEVQAAYTYAGQLTAELTGNVAVVHARQSTRQLRRGGTIWAKVGPYIVLFSDDTKGLFEAYPGLAAVRVITETSGGTQVAQAILARDELNDLTWRRALNVAGLARRDGTEKIVLLEDLIEWGEDHTEFEYNPRYVRRR